MALSSYILRQVSANIRRTQVSKFAFTTILWRCPMAHNPILFHNSIINKTVKKPIRGLHTTPIKHQEEKAHDHARLWIIEKGTSALLVVFIPFGLLIPNKLFDTILAILITAHTYWGMEAIMVEYVRVLLFGPLLPKIAIGFVYAITALMLGGLFYLIHNDIGMCRAFWRIWRNMRKPKGFVTKCR